MPTATLRPNADIGNINNPAITGGATYTAVLADDNDATYVSLSASSGMQHLRVALGDFVLPAGARITSVTPRIRFNNQTVNAGKWFCIGIPNVWDFPHETLLAQIQGFSARITQTGIARTTQADGAAWTPEAVNALTFAVTSEAGSFMVAECYLDVTYNFAPTATGAAPNATVGTTRPTFWWMFSDADGDGQQYYRVKVYSDDQYNAAGFNPNTTAPVADSGEVYSASTAWTCTTDLQNGHTYRAFIFVADTGSGGRYNTVTAAGPYAWAAISIAAPAVPELLATADGANGRVYVALQDRQNMLSADAASFETGTGGWTALANCTLSRVAYGAGDGAYALQMSPTSTGVTMQAVSPLCGALVGRVYSVGARIAQTNTPNLSVRVDIKFYNGSNALISTVAGVTRTLNGAGNVYATATAPANTATAQAVVTVLNPTAGVAWLVDSVVLVPFVLNMVSNPLFEVDTNGDGVADDWTAYNWVGTDAPATYALDRAVVYGGVASQRITWAANTGWKGVYQNAVAIRLGQQYTLSAWIRTDRTMVGDIHCDTAAGSHAWTIAAGTWTRVTFTFIGNGDNANAAIFVRSTTGAGTFWVGHVQLELGATASPPVGNRRAYVPGGLLSLQRFEVERSDDGGATWKSLKRLFWGATTSNYAEVNPGDDSQFFAANDYEVPRGIVPMYRVRSKATLSGNTLVSNWSVWQAANAALPLSGWSLKSLTDPARNVALNVHSLNLSWQSDERQAVVYAMGRANAVVLSDAVSGKRLDLELAVLDEAAFTALETLRRGRDTLLLQTPYGDHRYVRFGPAFTATHMLNGGGQRKYVVSTSFIEVDAP